MSAPHAAGWSPLPQDSAAAKAKKEAKKAAQAKQQQQLNTLRDARNLASPLSALPPMFQVFQRNGLDATLEEHTAATLEQPDRLALHAILEENMMPIFGKEEWEEEAQADKVKELEEEDTRLLIIRANSAGSSSPASSPVSKPSAEAEADAEKSEPSLVTAVTEAVTPTKAAKVSSDVLGFMHYRFEVENDALVVYIYELQIANREDTRRKGLGKFMLMLTEMIARKHSFGGVMLTCQRTNAAAQKFYESSKYTVDSISPIKVDPMADADDYNYGPRFTVNPC